MVLRTEGAAVDLRDADLDQFRELLVQPGVGHGAPERAQGRDGLRREAFIGRAIQSWGGVGHAGEGKRGHSGHIGYLLRQAEVAHRQRMERALSDVGLTPPQFAVLSMLVAYPGACGADVARLSLLTPQTVSVIVGNLERMGALRRRRHTTHGRVLQMDVTEDGRRLLARCRTRVAVVEQELLDGMNAVDEAMVRRWLVHVATLSPFDRPRESMD